METPKIWPAPSLEGCAGFALLLKRVLAIIILLIAGYKLFMNYYLAVFKKYAVFSGRARRAEYWYFTLFSFIVSILLSIVGMIIGDSSNIIGIVYLLVLIIPSLAVAVRRLHDIGKSGWWCLIGLIPIIGTIWIIVLLVRDSQPGDNVYGPNPKAVAVVTPAASV